MQRGGEHRVLGQRGDDDGGFRGAFDGQRAARPSPSAVAACASIEALSSANRSGGCARKTASANRRVRRGAFAAMIRAVFFKRAQGLKAAMARYPMRSSWRAYQPAAQRRRSRHGFRADVTGWFGAHPRARSGQPAHRLRRHRLRGGTLHIVAQGCIATSGGRSPIGCASIHARSRS